MCFRPPELNKMMTQCPECKGFNPPKLTNAKNVVPICLSRKLKRSNKVSRNGFACQ